MKHNRTAYRTIEILKYISSHKEVEMSEICTAMELPKTSCYDILETLMETGMIQVSQGQKKRYHLAVGAYQLGMGYLNHFSMEKAFEHPLEQLADSLNKTCFFGIPDKGNVIYMIKKEPENPILTHGKVGGSNPMYCTSLGKAMLAHMPESEMEALLMQMDYQPRTVFTHQSPESVKRELPTIRQQGYAVDFRELEDHGLCVGAPVFNGQGQVIGAVSASDLYRPDEDLDKVGQAVKATAKELSVLCGYMERTEKINFG